MSVEPGVAEQSRAPLSVEAVTRVGDVLPDGFSVVDLRGRHLAVNDAFCAMVGFAREELLGQPPDHFYWPEEELDAIRGAFGATMSGDFDHFRLTFKRKGGERFPVIVSPNVVRDETGQPAFFFATVKDISEVVRAREARDESEGRYEALADSTPYGIAVHVAGIVRYANASALAMLGVTEAEALGQPIAHFVHPDDQELVEARARAMNEGTARTPWTRERFVRKDGTVFHADVAGAKVRFEDEPAVQVVFRDVSKELERERLEAETNRLEAIGRLAGGVAHDFNNLLTVVMGACSFVLDHEGLPEQVRADLESASAAARHGSELTQQLLAFSRQEPLQLTSVALDAELGRIAPVLERMVGEDIALDIAIAPDCWAIRADRTQLERVLLNLVANARDALPEGGRVRVRATNTPAASVKAQLPVVQDYVRIEVVDDGEGMGEATRAQVFEPFFTTRRDQGGTGLGLATVYGIVVHSGGTVTLDSEPGRGTTVTLFWPRANREEQAPALGDAPREAGAETVLVVEDQELVRRVVIRSLQRDGYTVLEAEGYTDAMAWLERKSSIDLLLTDVVLQDRNGPAIVDAALARRPTLPVLFMSGYSDVPALTATHRQRPLLQKPFTPDTLSSAVRRVLDGRALDER